MLVSDESISTRILEDSELPLTLMRPPLSFDPLELGPHCEWIPPRNITIT